MTSHTSPPVESLPPPLIERFFYYSDLVIDDAKSPLLPDVATKAPARPFSVGDNAKLKKAWAERKPLPQTTPDQPADDFDLDVRLSPIPETEPKAINNRNSWLRDSTSRPSSFRSEVGFWPFIRMEDYPNPPESGAHPTPSYTDESASSPPEPAEPLKAGGAESSRPANFDDDLEPTAPVMEASATFTPSWATSCETRIPVGVLKLYQVFVESLQMKPIYWSPIEDEAAVVRGTWFYKDSMTPVDFRVAMQLEIGYMKCRAWSQAWAEMLKRTAEVGTDSERFAFDPLWPEVDDAAEELLEPTRESTTNKAGSAIKELRKQLLDKYLENSSMSASERKTFVDRFNKEDVFPAGEAPGDPVLFKKSQVIFTDKKTAYIIDSSLAPRAGSKNSPYSKYIKKGLSIGTPVVRGFDAEDWDRIAKMKNATEVPLPSAKEEIPPHPPVTDLVFVIHGIGQELSKRMKSFNFTRAINSFRQLVNGARDHPDVRGHLRKGFGEVMVLPVNWRSLIELGRREKHEDPNDPSTNHYSIDHITSNVLKEIRFMVSDVVFDVPCYFSPQYHAKMVETCILEANEIYQKWCLNNPGFAKNGRVHVLGHSLGSGLAVDILSNQPSWVPEPTFSELKIPGSRFLFNTKSLIICGSPLGIFLLLKDATLRPRKGLTKPGLENVKQGVAGEQKEFGCVAVENIYNVIHPYDPVAYLLNATVDSRYAASLKPAIIPREGQSIWSMLFSGKTEGGMYGPPASPVVNSQSMEPTASDGIYKPPSVDFRLSDVGQVVELDSRDFQREKIGEQRMYLLNDYGQIDFFMPFDRGPFQIPYLKMLSAHSSYWTSPDFARFLVLQIGRPSGYAGTVPSFRAVKKRHGSTKPEGASTTKARSGSQSSRTVPMEIPRTVRHGTDHSSNGDAQSMSNSLTISLLPEAFTRDERR